MKATNFFKHSRNRSAHARILNVVQMIPHSRVCTYSMVARLAGVPRGARLVGTTLRNAEALQLPWHRVITAQGKIAFAKGCDAYQQQQVLLQQEGIIFTGTRIDLRQFGWPDTDTSVDKILWGGECI